MKKLTRKAASLLLACALLLGLMPQPALAAGVELKYQSQGNGLYLGLTGLDEKDVIYGVQLRLTLTGELSRDILSLEPADGLAFSPDNAAAVEAKDGKTTLTLHLVSAYALNNQDTLDLGFLTTDGQAQITAASYALVNSKTFYDKDETGENPDNKLEMKSLSVGPGSVGPNQPSGDSGGSSSGGSSGGGASYEIKAPQAAHGPYTVSPSNARQGQVVTVTCSPEAGYRVEALIVTDASGARVAVASETANRYTFRMPGSAVSIQAVFSPIQGQAVDGAQTFTDVAQSDWFYDAVQYVCARGMMNGMGDGSFAPYTATSRGMIVTILYRLEGQPAVSAAGGFTDVAADQWYSNAVAWASANGIVTGYGEERAGQFGPNDSITRQQMAAILMRYANHKGYNAEARNQLTAFADAGAVEPYALEAMQWANAAGLINGVTESSLEPAGNANRAQAAAILMRFCENIAQ